jgi:ACS family hexuronate transporter-like MFS transporter
MQRGYSINAGRKLAMLLCAVCVVPILLVPYMHTISPNSAWPAVALFALAASAHQGWSANILSTPSDMFPSTAVSTAVGIGGAAGAAGGACFTWVVKHYFSFHPMLIFGLAAGAYLTALLVIHLLVPRLGSRIHLEHGMAG